MAVCLFKIIMRQQEKDIEIKKCNPGNKRNAVVNLKVFVGDKVRLHFIVLNGLPEKVRQHKKQHPKADVQQDVNPFSGYCRKVHSSKLAHKQRGNARLGKCCDETRIVCYQAEPHSWIAPSFFKSP